MSKTAYYVYLCFVTYRLVPENGVLSSGLYKGKCQTCNKEVTFWSVPSPVSEITFTVNGTQYNVTNPDPEMSLNEWIRNQPGLKGTCIDIYNNEFDKQGLIVCFNHLGTKVMCREAGCGCCVVSITLHDLSISKDVTVAVNSVREQFSFLESFIMLSRD